MKKRDIKEFALDLCETYARKHANEQFIKAYNKAEARMIRLCGAGNASDDPAEVVRFSNPLEEAAGDMQKEVVGEAREKVQEEVAKAK